MLTGYDPEGIEMVEYAAGEDELRERVAQELAQLENIGQRLGGAFVVGPVRRRSEGQVYVAGWLFEHTTAPLVQEQRLEPVSLPDVPEPEPALTEG